MINIVCALDCEAKPIINHFELQRDPGVDFKLYSGVGINLLVSGTEKINCQSAINQFAVHNKSPSAWLNIGVAGHRDLAVGTGRLINKITLENSDSSWYPPHLCIGNKKLAINTMSLRTVNKPEQDYPDNFAYDMEAAYFYQAAIKHQTCELVQCYKIISDNSESSIENISAKQVTSLVKKNIQEISEIIHNLKELATCLPEGKHNNIIRSLTDAYHFTQYQKIKLTKQVNRLALLGKATGVVENIPVLKSSDQVLDWLDTKIRELPVVLQ